MIIILKWIIKVPITLAAIFADVTEVLVVQWHNCCRDR